ncbi:MAG: hypothetical protein GXO61_01135 [Epsilonproteobacteria bacterium]|nr:hypothetical protein [Campylobacterota bacterium]
MRYGMLVLALIALGVLFFFTIKKSVIMLVLAILTIIFGYFFAVTTIAKEES